MSIMDTAAVRIAQPKDFLFVRDLARRFTNQIGFIPAARTEKELEAGHILLGELNDAEAGFLFIRPALSYDTTTCSIIQAAVEMDAQRQAVGLALVQQAEAQARARGQAIIQCWCRSDLDATAFWHAAGFHAMAIRDGGTALKTPHILYRKAIIQAADIHVIVPDPYARRPGGRFCKRT